MTQKPLDAILTRGNGKVQIALRCNFCDTVIMRGIFPAGYSRFRMHEWIRRKNDTVDYWHFCPAKPVESPMSDRRFVAVQYRD